MRIKILLTSIIGLAVVFMAIISCKDSPVKEQSVSASTDSMTLVKRGEYLVSFIGCDDCHSPKRMGPQGPELIPELRLSGFPQQGNVPPVNKDEVKKGWVLFAPDLTSAVGPWGQSFAANLTSDVSGIGNWTEENFIRALREGKFKGLEQGRNLLPPMPWMAYKNMTDEDIRAIFAYLKTTPPVHNIVPAPRSLQDL
ncbi:MAG: c-type cytochrome [Terrimonas sp.]|nr:c-type cytochrome [Terrimonas sp.]